MELTSINEIKYFKEEIKIQIVFEESNNTFKEFEEVFKFFDEFDKLFYHYSLEKSFDRNEKFYKRTRVLEISKKSPLEILVFIKTNWFDIFLFLLSTNRKLIVLNFKEHYLDFNNLIDLVQNKFKELAKDFHDFEREEIIKFIRWFDGLTVEQKYQIIQFIKKSHKTINKVLRILKK